MSTQTIGITATQSNGEWQIQIPNETVANDGDTVMFELTQDASGGILFLVVFPPNQQAIFESSSGTSWFFGTTSQRSSGGTVVNDTGADIVAHYNVFWSNGSAKAQLDPKVIVKPGTSPPPPPVLWEPPL